MTQAALQLAQTIGDLNACWTPHDAGQRNVLNSIYRDRNPITFVECGRKYGKTEIIAYFLWRNALTRPGGHYYFAPEQKQAKEIFWATQRLQLFGPQAYVVGVNNTEMRMTFTNGSFIKVDGSDNFNAYRGIEPHSAVYDEFRDFRPEFDQAFGPNLGVYEAPLLVCSTPPEALELDGYDGMKVGLVLGKDLFNFPSWANPHISKAWLRSRRDKLIARGEGDVWEREYGAKRVRGGSNAIFPMFDAPNPDIKKVHTKHVRPHAELMAEIHRDRKRLIWQVGADPGTATCFAVVFRAINPYTKKVYVLDEIYEKSQSETSTSKIMPRVIAMREELCPGWQALGVEWEQIYDEAETWFANESVNSFGEDWTATRKSQKPKNDGLSLLKDQMLSGLIVFSDRCVNTVKEIADYRKDKDGKIPKENDHTIDVNRYLNGFSQIDLNPETEPEPQAKEDARRGHTPEQDLEAESIHEDFGLDDF